MATPSFDGVVFLCLDGWFKWIRVVHVEYGDCVWVAMSRCGNIIPFLTGIQA